VGSTLARFRVSAEVGSIRKIGLEHTDICCQLVDPLVESMQMRVPIFLGDTECTLSSGDTNKCTHRVSCKVRYAARTHDRAQAPEGRVLLFGEPNTDHPRPRFQDCHVVFGGGRKLGRDLRLG